jgi:hypothetical protein
VALKVLAERKAHEKNLVQELDKLDVIPALYPIDQFMIGIQHVKNEADTTAVKPASVEIAPIVKNDAELVQEAIINILQLDKAELQEVYDKYSNSLGKILAEASHDQCNQVLHNLRAADARNLRDIIDACNKSNTPQGVAATTLLNVTSINKSGPRNPSPV